MITTRPELDELIFLADENASSDWEENFVADISQRARLAKPAMPFLTVKQQRKLMAIAHGAD